MRDVDSRRTMNGLDRKLQADGLTVREYGTDGPTVIVVHGGPGAPGSVGSLARRLCGGFRILEPFQRGSGGDPLTVDRHVADLHQVVESRCGGVRPALIGHSWGAMLALAYAAAHPKRVAALVLVGCGTFDPAARERLQALRAARMDDDLRRTIERLSEQIPQPDQRLDRLGEIMVRLDSYRLIKGEPVVERCDARASQETWSDMLLLQREGVYPRAFSAIDAPVLMLHGAFDPHPGTMIRDGLRLHLPRLQYREWERCGHYPWLEEAVGDQFILFLRQWLAQVWAAP